MLLYRSSGTVVLLYQCEITMIPVHGITTVGAGPALSIPAVSFESLRTNGWDIEACPEASRRIEGLALPNQPLTPRRAQQAAPLRFGCRNDKPRCTHTIPGRAIVIWLSAMLF